MTARRRQRRPLAPLAPLTLEERAIAARHAHPARAAGGPQCGRCDTVGPLSTWGKYAGVYCDPCSAATALERLQARPR